jgi:hypothetical protein
MFFKNKRSVFSILHVIGVRLPLVLVLSIPSFFFLRRTLFQFSQYLLCTLVPSILAFLSSFKTLTTHSHPDSHRSYLYSPALSLSTQIHIQTYTTALSLSTQINFQVPKAPL